MRLWEPGATHTQTPMPYHRAKGIGAAVWARVRRRRDGCGPGEGAMASEEPGPLTWGSCPVLPVDGGMFTVFL